MRFEEPDKKDLKIISQQLKSSDLYIGGIIERCKYGQPRIVLLDPLPEPDKNIVNYTALSNVMWLTCPYLNDRIHELENSGQISKISSFINQDSILSSMMKDAHANFYFLRNLLFMRFANIENIEKPENIFINGVGGTRNLDTLKCLHIHFCHYKIYKNNVAGLITYKLLDGKLDCKEGSCKSFPHHDISI